MRVDPVALLLTVLLLVGLGFVVLGLFGLLTR